MAASNRAYRDLNRTIRFKNMSQEKRESLRNMVTMLFKAEIPSIVDNGVNDQNTYDSWHHRICEQIRTYYRDAGVDFYYGQAQKWINMTIKYLYVIGEYTFDGIFQYLHIPIDNYVFSVAHRELGVSCPKVSWSRWDDYNGQYMAYQSALRSKIQGYYPLRWEFKFWMKESRHLEQRTPSIRNENLKKIRILQNLQQKGFSSESCYYEAMERINALKTNYHDYMTTAPINCDRELGRLPDADYDLTCALMTMLLREDYFCNGSFSRRYRAGQVEPILQRMIDHLSAEGR